MSWYAEGEARLLGLVGALPAGAPGRDAALAAPSLLPGWTRAHLVAHLIGNADALGRLVHWARTGEPTPMYADATARSAQIERDAARPGGWLVAEVAASSARLAAALDAMSDADLDAPVRTAMGREVPAREIPWMRTRESVVHALDLDLGADLGWCPPALVDALLTDAAARVGGRDGCPAVLLAPQDRQQTWRLGPDRAADTVAGTAVDLLTWLLGRSTGDDRPTLPRWL